MVILIPKLDLIRSVSLSTLVVFILSLLEITTYPSERVSTLIITWDTLISILGFVSFMVVNVNGILDGLCPWELHSPVPMGTLCLV
ncbi:hypothetical protein VULLAG_LOCUS11318 [Vulpes lagopus]